MKEIEYKDVKCTHCNYEWKYSGTMLYTTCPNCQRKTKTIEEVKEEVV